MTVTLRQLAEWVQGEIVGNGDTPIAAARALNNARPGDITFAEDERYVEQMHHSSASAAVVPIRTTPNGKPLIRVRDPLMAFVQIAQRLHPHPPEPAAAVHPSTTVHPTAKLGRDVHIDPFAVIGPGTVIGDRCRIGAGVSVGANCRIGSHSALHPHVVLYDETVLGERVTIHANSVIGADGFGYRTVDGKQVKVPQIGSVVIEDDVEIGACTTIDRGTFGQTRIGAGTKIDNLVQVAHNCQIGKHNLFVSQAGVAGSCSTGDNVILAGQVGVADHVHIGSRAVVGAQAGVPKDVPEGQAMLGSPATPLLLQKRILMSLEKLPELRKDVARIRKHLGLSDKPE